MTGRNEKSQPSRRGFELLVPMFHSNPLWVFLRVPVPALELHPFRGALDFEADELSGREGQAGAYRAGSRPDRHGCRASTASTAAAFCRRPAGPTARRLEARAT